MSSERVSICSAGNFDSAAAEVSESQSRVASYRADDVGDAVTVETESTERRLLVTGLILQGEDAGGACQLLPGLLPDQGSPREDELKSQFSIKGRSSSSG